MVKSRKYITHQVGSVHIELRGRIWHVRYIAPDGRRVRQSLEVTNLNIAQRKAREISDLLEQGDLPALAVRQNRSRMTFSEFLEEFRRAYTNWSPSTWKSNEYRLSILEERFGQLPLTAISTRSIETFLASVREQRSAATMNRYLATLKVILKMAVRWSHIARNPAEPVRMVREQKRPPRGLHDQELAKLLEQLEEHRWAHVLVLFAADTGMRWSEIGRLQWEDVALDAGYILVRQATKNFESRTIPISDRVKALLSQTAEADRHGTVFAEDALKKVRRPLERAGVAAGLGHVHFHMLRHTFATRLLDRGVPLNDVQALMGHKTPMMTQRYDHVHPERLQRAIDALAASRC